MSEPDDKPILCFCSFCGKNDKQVDAMVADEHVWQCIECWLKCLDAFRPYLDMQVERVYSLELKSKSSASKTSAEHGK
jgi:hypothetical protein